MPCTVLLGAAGGMHCPSHALSPLPCLHKVPLASPARRAASPHGEQPHQGIVPEVISVAGSREVAVLLLACNASAEACDCHTESLGLWGRMP